MQHGDIALCSRQSLHGVRRDLHALSAGCPKLNADPWACLRDDMGARHNGGIVDQETCPRDTSV
jgi:hypothetical protein